MRIDKYYHLYCYQLSYCFEQELSLIIYYDHKNDHYLINFSSYYFMANFSFIAPSFFVIRSTAISYNSQLLAFET